MKKLAITFLTVLLFFTSCNNSTNAPIKDTVVSITDSTSLQVIGKYKIGTECKLYIAVYNSDTLFILDKESANSVTMSVK